MRFKKFISIIITGMLLSTMTGLSFAENSASNTANTALKAMELHGFYPSHINFSSGFEKYIDSMDSISFAWGRLYYDRLDSVNTVKGENNNTMFYYPEDFEKPVKYAKSKGKPVQISIFTDAYNAERILPFKDKRDMAVKAIMDMLKKSIVSGEAYLYDGVVIDFEG